MATLFSCLVTTNKSLCAPAPGSRHFPSGAIPRIERAGLWNVTKCHDRLPGADSQHGHPFASGLEPPASADHPLPCLLDGPQLPTPPFTVRIKTHGTMTTCEK